MRRWLLAVLLVVAILLGASLVGGVYFGHNVSSSGGDYFAASPGTGLASSRTAESQTARVIFLKGTGTVCLTSGKWDPARGPNSDESACRDGSGALTVPARGLGYLPLVKCAQPCTARVYWFQ